MTTKKVLALFYGTYPDATPTQASIVAQPPRVLVVDSQAVMETARTACLVVATMLVDGGVDPVCPLIVDVDATSPVVAGNTLAPSASVFVKHV